MRIQYKHSAPVLDCCFHDAVHAYSGDCDNNLKMYDFNAGQENHWQPSGSHSMRRILFRWQRHRHRQLGFFGKDL